MRRRWLRAYRRASPATKLLIGATLTLTLALATNWIYQVISKPSELLFPVSGTLYKTPSETWREYGPIFRKYATNVISADLLAAIAQVESSGNPVVRTYWRWSWTLHPFHVYRPASSAVGMYQITDGTFAAARRYCIHDHTVAEEGPWNNWRSCWFNSLYARIVPADAVELTSAYLDRSVTNVLQRQRTVSASPRQQQKLAALIHLCGLAAGDDYARRGFRLTEGQRCGDHEVRGYLNRVNTMKAVFDRLARVQSDSLSASVTATRSESCHRSGSEMVSSGPVSIYHNPACGTSRATLALIRGAGIQPTIIEHLKTPPDRATLTDLLKQMSMRRRELLRAKEALYAQLGLGAEHWTDDQLIDQMRANPTLMNRPIVVTPRGVRLCRPAEAMLEILNPP